MSKLIFENKIKIFCACGDEMKMGNYDPDIDAISFKCSIGCNNQVFVEAISDQLSPDVEALIDIIRNQYKDEHELARNIIDGMNQWIKKG